MQDWVEKIKKHALVHYTENGWDILVECWTDEYISEHMRGCNTYEEFVIAVSDVLSVMDGYRSEVMAEVF